MNRALVFVLALGLAGCACLHPPPDNAVWGPCTRFDLNADGVIGAPDYALLMKRKPPPSSMDWAAFQHYFGKRCSPTV